MPNRPLNEKEKENFEELINNKVFILYNEEYGSYIFDYKRKALNFISNDVKEMIRYVKEEFNI